MVFKAGKGVASTKMAEKKKLRTILDVFYHQKEHKNELGIVYLWKKLIVLGLIYSILIN